MQLCAECEQLFAQDERLRRLGRSVTTPEPDDLTVKRVRANVLRDAACTPVRRDLRVPGLAAAALVLAASLAWVAGFDRGLVQPAAAPTAPQASVPAYSARVHAVAGAHFTQERSRDVERVRLDRGTIEMHVRHQSARERFLVDMPDGQIEVRGTVFIVTVEHGITTRVAVVEGVVALRLAGQPERLLHAHESFQRADPQPAPPALTDARKTRGSRPRAARRSGVKAVPGHDGAPAPDAYASAVEHYRAGRYDAAASAFHRFRVRFPGSVQAEDAAFLEAAALAHAGRTDAAALVAERFLDSYPPSAFHARDAALLVVREARDRGQCSKALHVAEPFVTDPPSPEWRLALGACRTP